MNFEQQAKTNIACLSTSGLYMQFLDKTENSWSQLKWLENFYMNWPGKHKYLISSIL